MRSLGRDRFRPTVLGIVVSLVLLFAWGAWFFLSNLTLYEVSQSARILEANHVTADFPIGRSLGRIREGQKATLRLDAFSWVQYGSLAARVLRWQTDAPAGTVRVELILDDVESFPVDVEPGSTGTVAIEVERISPAALVLRAAGRTVSRPVEGRAR
jgi:hypothetical protein